MAPILCDATKAGHANYTRPSCCQQVFSITGNSAVAHPEHRQKYVLKTRFKIVKITVGTVNHSWDCKDTDK